MPNVPSCNWTRSHSFWIYILASGTLHFYRGFLVHSQNDPVYAPNSITFITSVRGTSALCWDTGWMPALHGDRSISKKTGKMCQHRRRQLFSSSFDTGCLKFTLLPRCFWKLSNFGGKSYNFDHVKKFRILQGSVATHFRCARQVYGVAG